MIPKAKRNLHECKYHLANMLKSQNVEEFEINFAAFVNSARNVTFVLQKEFNKNEEFTRWYKCKQKEMQNDELLKFFAELRNNIIKEGINQIECNTTISRLNSTSDMIDKPEGSGLVITNKGTFYLINQGTPQEDLVPAKTTAQMVTTIFMKDAPKKHLEKIVRDNNIVEISKLYYSYLKNLVEEWTDLQNKC